MTAHYIAKVVESQYQKISIDEMLSEFDGIEKYKYGRVSDEWVNKKIDNDQYHRWLQACYLLEEYITRNFDTFVATELVEKWAKQFVATRNKLLIEHRANSWGQSFRDWLIENGLYHRGRFFGKLIK